MALCLVCKRAVSATSKPPAARTPEATRFKAPHFHFPHNVPLKIDFCGSRITSARGLTLVRESGLPVAIVRHAPLDQEYTVPQWKLNVEIAAVTAVGGVRRRPAVVDVSFASEY